MKLRYGQAMYTMLGIVAAREVPTTLSELARQLVGSHGRPITRQRALQLIEFAVQEGLLNSRLFKYHPNMRRA